MAKKEKEKAKTTEKAKTAFKNDLYFIDLYRNEGHGFFRLAPLVVVYHI